MKNESVLDHPREDLDPAVWSRSGSSYELTPDAEEKINQVSQWVMEKSGLSEFTLHIAGSITSNQFSDKSDVDLHFCVEGMP